MTKNERKMALGVGGAIALWVLNAFVVDPLLAARQDIANATANEKRDLEAEKSLVDNRDRYERVWNEYVNKGLLVDPLLAVDQVVANLNVWADEQNLTVGAVSTNNTPQPVNRPGSIKAGEREPGFMKVGAKYSVTGGMGQLTNFLSKIQNADIPVRISELSIATKSEGLDNQELSLTVNTIIRQTAGTATVATAQQQQRPPASNQAPGSTQPSSRRGGG